jgi:uncharacterized delta-60 repeat protein
MRWEKFGSAVAIAALLGLVAWMISGQSQLSLTATQERRAKAVRPHARPARVVQADAFTGFTDWQEKFRAAVPLAQPELIATGVQLAEARQKFLADLARKQPALAIERLLSLSELADLPEAIRAVSEQPISGTGSIDLRWATGGDSSEHHECQHHSVAYLGENSWRVNGPDYLAAKSPRANVPISGHLIQGELLVSTSPVRKLSGKNLAAARKLFPLANPDAKDPVTGNSAQPEIGALIGGKIYQFESVAIIDQVIDAIAKADRQADENRTYTVQYPFAFLAASGSASAAAAGSPVAPTPFQVDNIRVLFLRVDFSDKPGEPVSVADLQASLATTNTNLQRYSYGTASLIPTVATQLYRLPNPSTTYTSSANGSDNLHRDARSLAAANYTLANYDVVAVNFTDLDGANFGYAGLGSLGGGYQWINGLTSNSDRANVMIHEFGHNYGLRHSNYYDPTEQISGTYKTPGSLEYGDIHDKMGYAYSTAPGYFSPYSTRRLNWMPSGKVQQVTGNGTWRIYRFDDPAATANPLLALRVPLGGNEYWWIGMRQLGSGTANSAYVTAEGIVPNTPNLIDMTPGSASPETNDRSDATLPVLGNFYDPTRGVRISNLASGGISPNEWIDVRIDFGSQILLATTDVEVDEQAGNAVLTLKRTFGSTGLASVNYATAGGTATSGTDFLPVSGTVTWANGDLADKQVLVPIRQDAIADGGEKFTLTLSGATGAILVLSQSVATVTIREAGQQLRSFTADYFSSNVNAIARLADGKVLIGGSINTGLNAGNIARLNANGSFDSSFLKGTGFNGVVSSLVVQSDGKILCGGDFTSYNGTVCNRIARLNADGSLDNAFVTANGTGLPSRAYVIAIEATGKILVGGDFTTFNEAAAVGVVRLTSTGARDDANPVTVPFEATYSTRVRGLLAQADGKIMVIGQFYGPANGANFRSGVARLNADGTRDASFDPAVGLHAAGATNSLQQCEAIVRQPDGKYILAGGFTAYNRNSVSGVVRIYANGSYDSSFVTPAFNSTVSLLHLQPNGNVLVAGSFTTPVNRLAMLLPTGSANPGFSIGTGPGGIGPDGPVPGANGMGGPLTSIAADLDGSFWVGGNFSSYNGVSCWPIVKISGGVSDYDIRLAVQNVTLPIAELPVVEPSDVELPIVVTFTLTVRADKVKLGKVTGGGSYDIGSRVTLAAQPKKGRKFLGWFENKKLISKQKALVIDYLQADRLINARFK